MTYRPRHAQTMEPLPPGRVDLAWTVVAVAFALLVAVMVGAFL